VIRKGYISGIIGLPANLFYGTGAANCSGERMPFRRSSGSRSVLTGLY
jgi:hypothetical protein